LSWVGWLEFFRGDSEAEAVRHGVENSLCHPPY